MNSRKKNALILLTLITAIAFSVICAQNLKIIHYNRLDNSESNVNTNLKSAAEYFDWAAQVKKSVGNSPYGVFVGDANNDGQNDIVTANYVGDNVSILCWNTTSGGWDAPIIKTVGDGPYSVFIADANNDGQNDIVTANLLSNDVSILCWNITTNDWNDQLTRSVAGNPYSVFVADANNDGENDIVTANEFNDEVTILIWNVSITDWEKWNILPTGWEPYSVFVGDANNDGDNDIITANYAGHNVTIICWNSTKGYWDWTTPITKSVGNNPRSVFVGDVNNDGEEDIITANEADDTVSILLWNVSLGVSGDWEAEFTETVGDAPFSVYVEDANNDGENDIITTNHLDGEVSILLWDVISGDWDAEINKSVGTNPHGVFVGDANNDGQNDIVAANSLDNNVSILFWEVPSGHWSNEMVKAVGDSPLYLDVGDANNDGQNDIVVPNRDDNNVSIFLWDGILNNWKIEMKKSPIGTPTAVSIADANNDGHNEIVTSNGNPYRASMLLWNSTSKDWDAEITVPYVYTVGSNRICVGDTNNDGENDIVVSDSDAASPHIEIILWNTTSMNWDPPILRFFTPTGPPHDVFIGDTNNDGQNDIVVSNGLDHFVSILLWNRTSENWTTPITRAVNQPDHIYIADANNDGQNDIVAVSDVINKISILLWNTSRGESGDWDEPILKSVTDNSRNVHVDDMNNDGQNDIVVTNINAKTISIFLWNISSRDWDEPIIKSVGTGPIFVTVGDVSNDGQNDIVVSNYDDDTISILLWVFDSGADAPTFPAGSGDDDDDGNGGKEAIFGYNIIVFIAVIGCVAVVLMKKWHKHNKITNL